MKGEQMAEIIIAIAMWCGALGSTAPVHSEIKECRKVLFKCVRQKVTCSSCWSVVVLAPIYDSALAVCIEESL